MLFNIFICWFLFSYTFGLISLLPYLYPRFIGNLIESHVFNHKSIAMIFAPIWVPTFIVALIISRIYFLSLSVYKLYNFLLLEFAKSAGCLPVVHNYIIGVNGNKCSVVPIVGKLENVHRGLNGKFRCYILYRTTNGTSYGRMCFLAKFLDHKEPIMVYFSGYLFKMPDHFIITPDYERTFIDITGFYQEVA